jgi:cell division protease FtsH
MVTRFGMEPELGAVAYESETSPFIAPVAGLAAAPRWYSEATAGRVDAAVLRLIEKGLERARAILQDNRNLLDATAQSLLERETLGEEWLVPLAKRVIGQRQEKQAV